MIEREVRREYRRFASDHPGHPLGKGMPMGRSTRIEFLKPETGTWRGESHYEAWQRMVRFDPCSYCGSLRIKNTVDHIAPRSTHVTGIGGAHSWLNLTAACGPCNEAKSDQHMLVFMAKRKGLRQR